jgi:tetratricopeptide (TPR) repeat protein
VTSRALACALAIAAVAGCSRGRQQDVAQTSRAAPASPPPTYTKDIAPILFQNCVVCHRRGQAVPFTLLTYADVKPRVDKIAKATESRHMPPWLPEPATVAFIGERRLRDDQIALIQRWVKEGAVEGDPADMAKAPVFAEGWQFGQPDLVLRLPRAYVLAAGKEDVFRNIVLKLALPSTRFVRAIEFRPGPAPVVHHAVISLDRTRASRRRDGADGQPGYDGMITQDSQNPDGHFLGWTPGRGPIVSPDGLPWRLDRGADVIVQLHLLPGKQPMSVQPEVGLFFTDTPPARLPLMIKLGSKAIDIPAGQRDYAITDSYTLPADVDLLSLYPHAHYLGKQMQAVATMPDGSTRTLLRINEWSFHWQQDYRYESAVPLPRGTTITMRYTYDNSAANDDNPHDPPVAVRYGPNSTDEMGDLWLQVVPHSPADAALLARQFVEREALRNVAGAEMMVRHEPDNAKNQAYLGSSYAEAGRLAEAVPHLEYALRLDPRQAGAHNYLGAALGAQGRLAEALDHFRQAAALSPQDERMHFNYGNALNVAGKRDEAAREFQRAIAINPDFADAHENLGVYLESKRQFEEAIVHLRRAVELAPESATAHSDLGAVLGEAGKIEEALQHIRRALELKPDYAPARENLARLQRK